MIISNNEIMGIPENSLLIPDDLYEIVNIRDIFNHQQSAADVVLRKVTDVVTDSSIGETIKKGMKKDFRYVVNMTDEMKQAIDSGAIKFSEKSKGYISIFSLDIECKGVCENGLKYSLDNYNLKNTYPVGVSNEFTGNNAEISVKNGKLLIIFSFDAEIISVNNKSGDD